MGAYQDLLGRGRLSERVPLSGFTTYRFGGPARFFVEAESEEDVVDAGRLAADEGMEVVALGRGSNLVFADRGFDGVVIHTGVGLAGIEVSADGVVTGPYGEWRGGRRHDGMDIGLLRSLTVRAAAPGIVRLAGYMRGFEGYGLMVLVQIQGAYELVYAHLSSVRVEEGDYVAVGVVWTKAAG